MHTLTDKEKVVLDSMSHFASRSQRELSHMTGLSLGVINMILKRLVQRGLLRSPEEKRHQNKYILSTEGVRMRFRGQYLQILGIIRAYADLRESLKEILQSWVSDGVSEFIIPIEDDLSGMLRNIVQTTWGDLVTLKTSIIDSHDKSLLIRVGSAESPINFKGKVVDLLEILIGTETA